MKKTIINSLTRIASVGTVMTSQFFFATSDYQKKFALAVGFFFLLQQLSTILLVNVISDYVKTDEEQKRIISNCVNFSCLFVYGISQIFEKVWVSEIVKMASK